MEKSYICALYVLSAISTVTAECRSSTDGSSGLVCYCGAALNTALSSSDYKMDFQSNLPECGGLVHKKNSHSVKLGGGIFCGVKKISQNYCAAEIGVNFERSKMKKDITDHEAKEIDPANADGGRTGEIQTHLKCSHGTEYEFAIKLGKVVTDPVASSKVSVYGILGLSVRQAKVEYNYNKHSSDVRAEADMRAEADVHNDELTVDYWTMYPCKYKKHVFGIAPGIGAEFGINKNCSIGIEYKYKFYQGANKTRDLTKAPLLDEGDVGEMDTAARHYKYKNKQHSLSLRLVIDI
jgi:opacity protein-like surface antigen